jgi:regulator of sirC expression with transglutaminase-like and TPR domain
MYALELWQNRGVFAPESDAPWWHHSFFAAAVGGIDLTRAAYLISAHSSGPLQTPSDLDRLILRLDELAGDCSPTYDAWQRRVFVELGFSGNGGEYHDPRNSFLPFVVERRVGIPITLAVVAIEVGRRLGLTLWGVGMPGHFLIGAPRDSRRRTFTAVRDTRFFDPFGGGRELDIDSCSELYGDMFGGRPLIPEEELQPTPNAIVLIRMCANLKSNYARTRNIEGLVAVMRLRSCLPGVTIDEGREYVRLLDATGCWHEARAVLDRLYGLFPSAKSHAILDGEHARLAQRLN